MNKMLKSILAGTALVALTSGCGACPGRRRFSDGKIKIGVLNDHSGLYADVGGRGSVVAAQMAAEDFGGKSPASRSRSSSADHQNKADIASNIARQWFDREGVDAIADLTTSSVALAVQEVARDKGKVTLISGAGHLPPDGRRLLAHRLPLGLRHLRAGGRHRPRRGRGRRRSWFFMTADYAFGHSLEEDVTAKS